MLPQIFINEVHPNPESGSEWIELITLENSDNLNLTNYTIFDSYHQIYKFSNEKFNNQLLVIEVSGLNNDQDDVVFKDELGNILDLFQYDTTQKGLSWSKNIQDNTFTIEPASRNQINPNKTPITATPTDGEINPSPTQKITTATPTPNIANNPSATPSPLKTINSQPRSSQKNISASSYKNYHNYDLSKIKLTVEENKLEKRLTRLVFLGKNQGQAEIINAIIGSSLIILSSLFLIYVRVKKKHN